MTEDRQMNKYELTSTTKDVNGHKVYRIRALVDIPEHDVKAGDLGGWVEGVWNLDINGSAWVADEAGVYDAAAVCGDALVTGHAQVCGNAEVFEHARVCDSAGVYGFAKVCGSSVVQDYACVSGHATVSDRAKISSNAHIHGDAVISGSASVGDCADVDGASLVCNMAKVSCHAAIQGCVTVSGMSYVGGHAKLSGHATVTGSAVVSDSAQVTGWARVIDSAKLTGSVSLSGSAVAGGRAMLHDGTLSGNNRSHLVVGPIAFQYITLNLRTGTVCVGGFKGTINEFDKEVHEKYACNDLLPDYERVIDYFRASYKEAADAITTFIKSIIAIIKSDRIKIVELKAEPFCAYGVLVHDNNALEITTHTFNLSGKPEGPIVYDLRIRQNGDMVDLSGLQASDKITISKAIQEAYEKKGAEQESNKMSIEDALKGISLLPKDI